MINGDNMKNKKSVFIIWGISLFLIAFFSGCNFKPFGNFSGSIETAVQETVNTINTSTPYPTYTKVPTDKPYPTYTKFPTNTPYPTYTKNPTNTPQATYTKLPTNTPYPTYTKIPTGTFYPTYTKIVTNTPYPTYTKVPTYKPYPTYTEIPTQTKVPTYTPFPTQTADIQYIVITPTADERLITQDKDNGFYLVDTEIAKGVWRSDPGSSKCYWKITDINGNIIKNFLGESGGTISLTNDSYQLEIANCGPIHFFQPIE